MYRGSNDLALNKILGHFDMSKKGENIYIQGDITRKDRRI